MLESIDSVSAALTAERRTVAQLISAYPRPISGCDAQFNHLLDMRRRLERGEAERSVPEPIPTSRTPD